MKVKLLLKVKRFDFTEFFLFLAFEKFSKIFI